MQTLEEVDFKLIQNDFPFVYDVVIIGGGIAGISAAIEATDRGLKVLVVEETGLMSVLDVVTNFREIGMFADSDVLSKNRLERIMKEKNIHIKYSKVISVFELAEKVKKVHLMDGIFLGKTVIFASGVIFRKRKVPNPNLEFAIDPMMDIIYYIGKKISVLGNNIHAFRIAEYCSPLTATVDFIIENEFPQVCPLTAERIYALGNLKVHKQKVFDIIGDNRIEKVLFENGDTIETDVVFDCSHPVSNTVFLNDENLLENDFIAVNVDMETMLPGVYAIGACRKDSNFMTITAINDAHVVVRAIERYLLIKQ